MDHVGDAAAPRRRQPDVRELLPAEDVVDGCVARDQSRRRVIDDDITGVGEPADHHQVPVRPVAGVVELALLERNRDDEWNAHLDEPSASVRDRSCTTLPSSPSEVRHLDGDNNDRSGRPEAPRDATAVWRSQTRTTS